MIGTTLVELVFIRLTITLSRLVAPLSTTYLAVECWKGTLDLTSPLSLYALSELTFLSLVYLPRKSRLQQVSTPRPPSPIPTILCNATCL